MTAQDIVDEVQRKLRAEQKGKVAGRRDKVATLAAVRARWQGLPRGMQLRRREGAVFTTDQSLMMKVDRGFQVKLLVLGHHVANVRLSPDFAAFKLTALDAMTKQSISVPQGPLAWSHDREAGETIRRFINECMDRLSGKTPELQVQLQLVVRLCGSKADEPELANLQPVMPFGFPTEIATVVDRNGEPATGNMDILARTVQGARRGGGEFVVMELKKPRLVRGEVTAAFRQAIGYAAALSFEANGLDGDQDATNYRLLFAPSRGRDTRPPNYQGKPLVAHAVVVLPFDRRAEAERELRRLALDVPPRVHGRRLSVGVLLYDAIPNAKTWTLVDRSFKWIEHAGSWRPRAS